MIIGPLSEETVTSLSIASTSVVCVTVERVSPYKLLGIMISVCFDDRCNDRSGWFPHAVKPGCGGINVYMNLDDTLKNETLMFDV